MYRVDEINALFKEVDDVLYKRFGFRFKHISANGTGYAVVTSPPPVKNVLNRHFLNIFLKYKPEKYSDSVTDFFMDMKKINGIVRNNLSIIKKNMGDGLTIDIKNARYMDCLIIMLCYLIYGFLINKHYCKRK